MSNDTDPNQITSVSHLLAMCNAPMQWRAITSHALPTSPASFIGPAERARQLADTIPGVRLASELTPSTLDVVPT
jgi:hypothetical protein